MITKKHFKQKNKITKQKLKKILSQKINYIHKKCV